jgi:hypothetical protein
VGSRRWDKSQADLLKEEILVNQRAYSFIILAEYELFYTCEFSGSA